MTKEKVCRVLFTYKISWLAFQMNYFRHISVQIFSVKTMTKWRKWAKEIMSYAFKQQMNTLGNISALSKNCFCSLSYLYLVNARGIYLINWDIQSRKTPCTYKMVILNLDWKINIKYGVPRLTALLPIYYQTLQRITTVYNKIPVQ